MRGNREEQKKKRSSYLLPRIFPARSGVIITQPIHARINDVTRSAAATPITTSSRAGGSTTQSDATPATIRPHLIENENAARVGLVVGQAVLRPHAEELIEPLVAVWRLLLHKPRPGDVVTQRKVLNRAEARRRARLLRRSWGAGVRCSDDGQQQRCCSSTGGSREAALLRCK